MARRVYTVTIDTPEAENDFMYTVNIVRHREIVANFNGVMVQAQAWIGQAIMQNVAEEA